MASKNKLPWATALILIVAAVAVGTWAIMGTTSVETPPPTPTYGTLTVVSSNTVFTGATPTTTGIENIYIMKHLATDTTDENEENLGGDAVHENVVTYGGTAAIITASAGSVNVPQNELFDIIITIRIDNDNVVDPTRTDNFYVLLKASGAYTIGEENSTSENMFCIDNGSPDSDWGRWNVVYNNGGAGFSLTGGQSLSLDNVDLYGWVW